MAASPLARIPARRKGRLLCATLCAALGLAACLAGSAAAGGPVVTAVSAATVGSGAAAASSPARSAPTRGDLRQARCTRGWARRRPCRERSLLGRVSGSRTIALDVALRPRDPASLARFATAVSTPGSTDFRRYLSAGEFGATFGATAATVSATATALRTLGLHVDSVSRNRLLIKVSSTVATAERAFGTTLRRYRLGSGSIVFANSSRAATPGGRRTRYPDRGRSQRSARVVSGGPRAAGPAGAPARSRRALGGRHRDGRPTAVPGGHGGSRDARGVHGGRARIGLPFLGPLPDQGPR